MNLDWKKCQGDIWGPLLTVDLNHTHFNGMEGVYIIWQKGGRVIRIGQGFIRDRLTEHRNNRAITAYNDLFVTWAPVVAQYRDGIERYLAETLKPLVGEAFPDAPPIQVNLP